MTALLVIRHGKTVWNLEKKIQGRRNIPLCDEGRAQLRQFSLPAEFSHFNWVSSPLIRARETAELLDGVKIAVEERLIEMDWGAWEGYTIRDLRSGFGAAMAQNEAKGLHMTPDGGESPADVQARLLPWLRSLTVPTIAVTHKGVIRALKSLAYHWDMTDKSPVPFDWNCAHLFDVDRNGDIVAKRVNISLERE